MAPEDAEEYTQALGQVVAGGWRQVALGERLGVPDALGLSTRDWVEQRLGGYVRMSIPERREAVAELSEQGMSTREIGSVLGVDQKTVNRDQQPEANASPEPGPEPELQVEPEPKPEPEAFASPEPDVWPEEQRILLKQVQDGETVVVNQRLHTRLIDWAETAGLYVRIDRRSDWGNPFETPADGDRDTVIRNYAEHYLPLKPSLLSRVDSLRGRALGCWCAPEACHGDILKAQAEG